MPPPPPPWQQQLETQLVYGFSAFSNRFTITPAVGLTFSLERRNDSLLWELSPYSEQRQAEPWNPSLEGERQRTAVPLSLWSTL